MPVFTFAFPNQAYSFQDAWTDPGALLDLSPSQTSGPANYSVYIAGWTDRAPANRTINSVTVTVNGRALAPYTASTVTVRLRNGNTTFATMTESGMGDEDGDLEFTGTPTDWGFAPEDLGLLLSDEFSIAVSSGDATMALSSIVIALDLAGGPSPTLTGERSLFPISLDKFARASNGLSSENVVRTGDVEDTPLSPGANVLGDALVRLQRAAALDSNVARYKGSPLGSELVLVPFRVRSKVYRLADQPFFGWQTVLSQGGDEIAATSRVSDALIDPDTGLWSVDYTAPPLDGSIGYLPFGAGAAWLSDDPDYNEPPLSNGALEFRPYGMRLTGPASRPGYVLGFSARIGAANTDHRALGRNLGLDRRLASRIPAPLSDTYLHASFVMLGYKNK